ncbi:MAG TPA: sigma-54 dependent transcriptional regulator [Vicinamibacterales bacterium]|nr:sigma-54 dependent transcriptional regulator [Vicinamibacterales bacterium]
MPDARLEARFQTLVQSPLRAALLRFLEAHRRETFDVDGLMQTFGRLRLDVENCLRELETFGVVARGGRRGHRYRFAAPADAEARALVEAFMARGAAPSPEDRSGAVRRFREMIGRDEKMLIVFEWIRTAAKADIAVLILGPTGSGKDVVAHMIHELSARRDGRFQAIDCAAVPDALFESEIFGHERGAFTGAVEQRQGRLELADKGTLFLDEIGELSLPHQGKLLRAIEEQRFERLGGTRPIDVDFRLISATNQPVEQMVRDGAFREDLYYRVNAFSIRLPSLRERAADIPVLAGRFLAQQTSALGLPPDARRFSPDALRRLAGYAWPGNIRELEGAVARALLAATGRTIGARHLDFLAGPSGGRGSPARRLATLAEAERQHILVALEASGWNKRRAAEALGVSRGTLYRKIDEYGLARG